MISICRHSKGAVVFLCLCVPLLVSARPIRLRNATIEPPRAAPAAAAAAAQAVSPTQSGLFLIQFTNAPSATQREQLAAQGIELLRYVPDDTYIARFRSVTTRKGSVLASANFITPYLPAHKLDARLTTPVKPGAVKPETTAVRIVLAPNAPAQEGLAVRRMLSRIHQDNPLRLNPVLRGDLPTARLEALAESPAVIWVEADRPMKMHDEVSSKIVAGDGGEGQTLMQSLGFDGTGVTISVADSGLHSGESDTMHPDLLGRTPAFFYYGNLTDAADEHSHGTHVAGIIAGNGATGETDENGALYGLGVAPGASIVTQRLFDGVGNYEAPPSYETLTRDATEAGAVIGSNSWGDDTQGRYDVSAAEFDELVRDADFTRAGDQPYILEFSAGNAGPGAQTIGSPAVAKNVIATGACQSDRMDLYIYDTGLDTMADFSSRGPCEDGRIKPDLVAPGTWIASLQSGSATDENAWGPISPNYIYMGGTSQAGPHASGAAAVFVQYYRSTHTNATPSPALVKAALINSATPMDPTIEVDPAPNNDEGWGRIDLPRLIASARRYDFIDQSTLLASSQIWERRVIVASPNEPFIATLAYTDVPGLPAAISALVNDLDLEVVSPDGTVYRGNQFFEGESIPNAALSDALNNVEGVFIQNPASGEYVVRIRATHVAEDARRETGTVDQDFALVVSGDLPLPGSAIVLLDRRAYTAPSEINVRLIDPNLTAAQSVSVNVRSTSDPSGAMVNLVASGSFGSFTGAVATVSGSAVPGHLRIAHGDVITASYIDGSGTTNLNTSIADLVPPVLGNVTSKSEFGQLTVSWSSDEPSTSIVRYGTNATALLSVTNRSLTTGHEIGITGLTPGQAYNFAVVSSDEAGNTVTNNNGGAFYTVIARPAASILVVDAYVPDIESTPVPLETYTDALNQIGVSYDIWDISQRGSPTTNTLNLYLVVIWRISDSVYGTTTLSADQQKDISAYVDNGGGFFMSSMEILSRLGDVPFRRDFLHVSRFISNPDIFGAPTPSADEDCTVPGIMGVANDPIGTGVQTTLDYSAYPILDYVFLTLGPDFSDTFGVATNAAPIFVDSDNNRPCGMRYPRTGQVSKGRVVFLSFPLDTIPADAPAPNNRASVLDSIIRFLAPGINNSISIAFDSPAYTVPGRATIELADMALAGQGSANVVLSTSSRTNGVSVAIPETQRKGLFRGPVALVSNPAAGEVGGADGDELRADYFGTVGQGPFRATALVDTQTPTITNVEAWPDYQAVTFFWDTSKESDSLVQLGTSAFFDRTGYDPELTTAHEVTIQGLAPDTEYVFRVVSRDIAGNTSISGTITNLYTVRTLSPVSTPWADNMDGEEGLWDIYVDPDMGGEWVRGTPNNSLATEAHSPPSVWGSNLNGVSSDLADAFLISPAIYLKAGEAATLRFWHFYDFTEKSEYDFIEGGVVYVVTNSDFSILTPLATYTGDVLFDWEEVELNLTPYSGQVIYLVWEYQLFGDMVPRTGWMIDDVSVEGAQPSSIQITNNLWQASWALTGPMATNGAGLGTTLDPVPPGTYNLTWNSVPDYETPSPQTFVVAPATSSTLAGLYTMTDTNHNGISDSWEQRFFGNVGASHPASTDTDGDGMSDYAEFMAGTNPTNASSALRLSVSLPPATPEMVQIDWTPAPNHAHRVLGSTNAMSWAPVSEWLYNKNHFLLAPPRQGEPYLFRVEVKP